MCARVFAAASEMVEHTAWSAQTSSTQQQQQQHHHQQSFNGTQRGWYRHHRRSRDGADDFLDDHHSDVSVNGGAPHSHHHHRFSLFRWFKRRDSDRGSRRQHAIFRRAKRRASTSSTSSSVDTFYSTATVRSFAFHSGARREARAGGDVALTSLEPSSGAVGPFAPGAAKLVERRSRLDASTSAAGTTAAAAATCTLPSGFSQRQGIEARYSLHPVGNPFISYDNIPIVRPRTFAEVRRRNNENDGAVGTVTSDSSLSSAKKVHVKGKRRAPEPPVTQRIVNVQVQVEGGAANGARPASRGRRKRRPAPKPPGYTETLSSNQDTLSSGTSITGMDACLAARDNQTISNDTLVLRRGVLLSKKDIRSSRSKSRTPTTSVCESDGGAGGGASTSTSNQTTASSSKAKPSGIMPRPWYKRTVFNDHSSGGSRDSTTTRGRSNGDVLRGVASPIPPETKDENVSSTSTSSTLSSSFPFESSLSRLNFFRGDRHHKDDKKKENKRKSGVSILTNISELDKEAAAIVQEEQARNRASMILQATRMDEEFDRRMAANEEIVQEIVNSSMENSPRRSARALISKFNAMGGNINKITVNSNFFTRNGGSGGASPKAKAKRYSGIMDDRAPRDLSKYFLPRQSSSPLSPRKESAAMFTEIVQMPKPAAKPTTPTTTTTTTTKTVGEKVTKPEEGNNDEFAKSLAAELDDVATGIARLRRELDERPKLIDDQEKKTSPEKTTAEQKKETPVLLVNNLSTSRDKELANFDKEFTRIFDEIDKQLRTRDSRLLAARTRASANETSLSNQVAKVLDILVNAEKDAAAAALAVKTPAQPAKESKSTDVSMDNAEAKKEPRPRPATVRISGVDDKTTTELKEMLKEMKHSLPKRPKPGSCSQPDEKKSSAAAASTSGVAPVAKVSSTKVSSGVQTSGNVRRIVNEPPPPRLAYQLIKPGEFEAAKSKAENTYANVMERSVNANAQVAPRREGPEKRVKIDSRDGEEDGARGGKPEEAVGEEGEKLDDIRKQCMNTLAVNRLLRKLEAAIASGHHQQAAGLARELAQLKIHCSVVRQRAAAGEKLNLSMYIEDKQAHQGPIPLQLPTNMTVAQLKAKIQLEFEIPSNVQRWIIGKNLADNDESTLEDLQAVEGSPVFLYLVAPPGMHASKKSLGDHAHESLVDLQDKEAIKADKEAKAGKEEEVEEVAKPEERVINEKNDEQVREDEARAEAAVKRDEAKEEVMPMKVEAKEEVEEAKAEEPPPPTTQAPEEKKGSLSKEEKLKRYEEELMTLENCDAISNAEPIECPVCFMITIPGEGVVLRDCLHSFCRICVANTVRYCEEAEVKCPYRDADYTCESTLQEREIKALVAPEVYQQHLAKSITQAENSAGNNAFHCKTPDCPGWCIYDDNVNNFLCPVCKVNNCLTCQAIHMGKNCRQYQEELKYSKDTDHESKRTAAMLEEMVDRGEALPCPTCAVVLMKKWGCDWLRCSMCKTEICWVTRGPRWGPGGKGDTSGGCRCGENGVKCHPRCNYCH